MTKPRSITVMRSASLSASSRYCVVRRIVVPSAWSSRTNSQTPIAATRVEPGRRLVEEQHGRPADQACGDVQPSAHAARVGLRRPVGRLGQVEAFERLAGAAARLGLAEPVEPAHHLDVLEPGEVLVDGGALPGQPDPISQFLARPCTTSSPSTSARPLSGCSNVVRMRTVVVFPAPFGPEHAQHGARLDLEVDAFQGLDLAEVAFELFGSDDGSFSHADQTIGSPEFGQMGSVIPGVGPIQVPVLDD